MNAAASAPHSDQKESLSSGRKPDLTHMRVPTMVYNARACEYGVAKGYARGNFLRPTVSLREDFKRLRAYVAACLRHLGAITDAMEAHVALDPELVDDVGMMRAAYCSDEDQDLTGTVGPSGLPHLCGAVASLNMAVTQATRAGLLPADPGQPWVARARIEQEIERRTEELLVQERQEHQTELLRRHNDELAKLRCRCDSTPAPVREGSAGGDPRVAGSAIPQALPLSRKQIAACIRRETRDGADMVQFMLDTFRNVDGARTFEERTAACQWLADRGTGRPMPTELEARFMLDTFQNKDGARTFDERFEACQWLADHGLGEPVPMEELEAHLKRNGADDQPIPYTLTESRHRIDPSEPEPAQELWLAPAGDTRTQQELRNADAVALAAGGDAPATTLTDIVDAGAARFDQRPIERASVDARAELTESEPLAPWRSCPDRPHGEYDPACGICDAPERAVIFAGTPLGAPASGERITVQRAPATPSDACTRGQPLGDQPYCGTHDVPLDRAPRSGVELCRLTQREVA